MTRMEDALREAGIIPARERLRRLGTEAIATTNNLHEAKAFLLAAVQKDAALMWEMFAPYRDSAMTNLLKDIHTDMRHAAKATGAYSSSGAGHVKRDDHHLPARPAWSQPSAAQVMASKLAVSKVVRMSLLQTFKITVGAEGAEFEIAVGNATPNQARSWARGRKRDLRFVELLTAGVPVNKPIGSFRTDDEADEIWKQANKEALHVVT